MIILYIWLTNLKKTTMKNQKNYVHILYFNQINVKQFRTKTCKLIWTLLILISSFHSIAQPFNYTHQSIDPSSLVFTYTDNIVTERFRPGANYGNDGFVVFRSTTNSSIENLIIELLDEQGNMVVTNRYNLANGKNLVPKAAAYNENTQQYIVTGNARGLVNSGTYDAWYLILDQDLGFVHFGGFWFASSFAGISSANNSTVVMDVCPVLGDPGIDFAFTGTILESGTDPTPQVTTGVPTPSNRRMFIAELASNYSMNIKDYELTISASAIDRYHLPARIIEIPDINSAGGYFVTGTGVINYSVNNAFNDAKGIFYLRTNYNLVSTDFIGLDDNISTHFFTMSQMYYDIAYDEVKMAGSMLDGSTNAFIFDKLIDASLNATLDPFSINAGWWAGQIGIKHIPTALAGIPKVGFIGTTYTPGNRIVGRIYQGANSTLTLPVLLSCLYFDSDMKQWTPIQGKDIHYYPRVNNNINAVQYYAGHNINELWYPNHSSGQTYYAGQMDDGYELAGLSNQGTGSRSVINTTDTYFINDCAYSDEVTTQALISFGSVGIISVVSGSPSPSTNTLSYNTPSAAITDDLCSGNPFRSNELLENIGSYVTMETDFEINIICNKNDKYFDVLNSQGSVINNQNIIENGTAKYNTTQLASGLYFFRILDERMRQIKVVKFIIN